MRKASNPQGMWWQVVFFLTALLVAVADQLTKLWIMSNLDIGESLFEVGIFQIVRRHNTGASFGLFQDHSFALTIASIVGIALLLFYALFAYRRYPISGNWLGMTALGLILGGTIGNLIDRLRFGGVTDFISIGWWPAFNIADSAIVVGAILFAYSLLLSLVRKH
ncbi:MAG: signal peptidase II [Dehalococcoidales bacterium]|nr:signal peptidase II [Dehalococcoidales bacterium]